MINIEEKITKKVPGETSLFITFNYKKEYVDIIKALPGSNYSKKDKTWEVPLTYLSNLIDKLTIYDTIDLKLLEDEKEREPIKYNIDTTSYKIEPFPHQLDAIQYGLNHDKWLLLDCPGLGKSFSLMATAIELNKQNKINKCLIICGFNTLKLNWQKEITKFTHMNSTILGEKITRNGTKKIGSVAERVAQLKKPINEFFVITNVESLRSPEIIDAINNGPNQFDMVIFDEIQKVKTSSSHQGSGILKLNKYKYFIGATGTPIISSPLDAYVPLRCIGVERSTETNFKYYYCTFGGPFNNIICGFKNMNVLKDIMDKYSLRRTKDLLNLPPKMQIDEYLEMEDSQETFYNNIKKGIKDQVDKVKLNTTSLLALITRLRQATSCPSILTTENIPSAKIDRAIDLVEQITSNNNEKVVIFTMFKETVAILADRLKQYNPLICTGDVDDTLISSYIDQFQNDDKHLVFIATIQKAGTGITLTRSSNAIFVDLPFTYSEKLQAEDRVFRIGTKNTVMIYNLITCNTIDERVQEIVNTKEALGNYLVDGDMSEKTLNSLRNYLEEM